MYEKLIFHLALLFIKESVKDPQHAAEFKQEMLDISDAIHDLFPEETK